MTREDLAEGMVEEGGCVAEGTRAFNSCNKTD
jgi:hypothetical protein